MSATLTNLCSVLLRDFFGEIVQSVGTYLLKHVSSCPLKVIVKGVSLPLSKVRAALLVLIQHGFCTFIEDEKGIVEYIVEHEDVLLLIYYERYVYCVEMYGEPSSLIIDEIINHGRLTMSEALQKVSERLREERDSEVDCSLTNIRDKFAVLIEKHFLIRCPYPHNKELNQAAPNLTISEQELYIVPQIQLNLLEPSTSQEVPTKKKKIEFPDCGIYWKINHDRFIEYFRNDIIMQACASHMDPKAAEVVKTILTLSETKSNRLSPTTLPILHHEILESIQKTTNIKSQELDSYISVLCEGTHSFVSKADDRSGGMYVVNIKKVFQRVVESLAASVVQDRFGSKCARIFRILLSKKVMESKQIEDVAMLHPKDTKEYIYKMFGENFIMSHDIPKGTDYSHGQSIYLLHIDIIQVCQMLLERCYLSLFNLIVCIENLNQENKRLLEKKQRIDAIIATIRQTTDDEEQIIEIQNNLTPPEEAVIKKVTSCNQKTDLSIIQLSEMILIISIWLECSKCQ